MDPMRARAGRPRWPVWPERLVIAARRPAVARARASAAAAALVAAAAVALAPAPAAGTESQTSSIEADFIAPANRQPAADLALTPDNTRQAEAFAAFIRGAIAEDEAETDAALEAYQRVLELDPSSAELAIKVAFELARRGDAPEGINVIKDAIKVSPKNPILRLYLSQLYARYLKKFDVAIRHAREALDLDPKNFPAYACLYELYVAANQRKAADQVLDKAVRLTNPDPQFWIELADLCIRFSLREGEPLAADPKKRLATILDKGLAAAGDNPETVGRIADFFAYTRQLEQAIALYRRIVAKQPASDAAPVVQARDKLARSLYAVGRKDEALAELRALAQLGPDRYETREMLGQLLEERGDFAGALEQYRQSLAIDPNQPLNYLRISDMLLRLDQPEPAADCLRQARDRFTDLPQITYSLAVALGRAKRHGEALAMFESALVEAQRVNPQMLNGAFFFAFGAAAEQAGDLGRATQLLRHAIELEPGDPAQALNYLGYMWIDRNMNLDEAATMVRRALEFEPDNPAFLDSLGWYYYRVGKYDQALAQLLRAAGLISPEDAVIYDHLGDTYAKLGKAADALEYWGKALAVGGDNPEIAAKIAGARQAPAADPPPAPGPPAP